MNLHHGDCIETMAAMPDASIDAIVTDPPYGLGFMGKAWDGAAIVKRAKSQASKRARPDGRNGDHSLAASAGTYDFSRNAAFGAWCLDWAAQAHRILKPGAHVLAFGGTRTYHRLACAVEDAGFEIRDSLHWIYGSGFPKSHNLDGDWDGWGSALKPSHEPIVIARKPPAGTIAANVLEHGTGALNIEASRVGVGDASGEYGAPGRWPPNVILTHCHTCTDDACCFCCPVEEIGRQSGELSSGSRRAMVTNGLGGSGRYSSMPDASLPEVHGDSGTAARFFHCFRYEAKAASSERNANLGDSNLHPTVKPVDLMRWLVRLVTPPGGTVLDPFMGSGTTGIAACRDGFDFVGIERDADYFELARRRIEEDAPLFLRGTT